MRTTTRAALRAVALLGLVVGGLVAVLPSASADVSDVTVTWPTVTSFNPDAYDYVVDVAYDGPGTLRASEYFTPYADPIQPGATRLPVDLTTTSFVVMLCLDTCELVSTSPVLHTWNAMRIGGGSATLGPHTLPFQRIMPSPQLAKPAVAFDLDWSVTPAGDPGGAPVLAGTATDVTAFPPLGDSDELVQGESYTYTAHIKTVAPEWGDLEDSATQAFVWDATAPTMTSTVGVMRTHGEFQPATRFYPARDKYEDRLIVRVTTDPAEPTHQVAMTILAADGTVAEEQTSGVLDGDRGNGNWSASWDGKLSARVFAPAGEYVLELTAQDRAGNTTSTRTTVEVSSARKTRVRWVHTFRAAPTIIREKVGSCARMLSPARKGWSDSIGYRSGQHCARDEAAELWTMNAASVPTSPFRRYEGVRVTVNGGAARGSSSAEPVMSYLDYDDDWCCWTRLGPQMGAHPGEVRPGNQAIHDLVPPPGERPYVIWAVVAGAGLRYDVRSFTVRVDYYALR